MARRVTPDVSTVPLWGVNVDVAAAERAALNAEALEVADSFFVQQTATRALAALGQIVSVLCLDGITGATPPVQAYPLESLKQLVAIDLSGLHYFSRAIMPALLERSFGRTVAMASASSNLAAAAISAFKTRVVGVTKSGGKKLAGEFHPEAAPADLDRLNELKDPGCRAWQCGDIGRHGLLGGVGGMQLHQGLDFRHCG